MLAPCPPPVPAAVVAAAPVFQGTLFAALGRLIAECTPSPALARAARDTVARDALWRRHWPALRHADPEDLRVALCFVLACQTLGLAPARGLAFAAEAASPTRWMRLFLADHGLMDLDALAAPPRPASAGVAAGFSRRRTRGANAPRPG